MIQVFPGRGSVHRPLATGYLIDGKIAIDAPEGVEYPSPWAIFLTHEHCDHICGMASHACPAYANRAASEQIELGNTFCDYLNMKAPPPRKIIAVSDGQELRFGGFTLRTILTPGHSPGSMCIYLKELQYLFSGDTVFPGLDLPNLSLPRSNPSQLMDSYEKLSKLEIEKFFPGHGEPFSGPGYMEKLKEELSALLQQT
ncbi:MAG TPA: MBL fold metallo-hydrolase [Candidatus Bilamarchaeaceae archaeon]|nr:MBL fold metallo-hydrolase [Candidatus Bilamarchaeaceae archaeon]